MKTILCLLWLAGGLFLGIIAYVLTYFNGTFRFYHPVLIATGVALLVLVPATVFAGKGRHGRLKLAWLALGLALLTACGTYEIRRAIDRAVPRFNESGLDIDAYAPFAPGTKAVHLDEPATLRLEYNLPRMDGALALYPLYAAFAQAVYPPDRYSPNGGTGNADAVHFTNTIGAYTALIEGQRDIIFVAGPSAEQRAAAEKAGVELVLTPIGREAFVFFVNSRNPVDGLSSKQLRDIYTGALTNWREVGGRTRRIVAFQRNIGSGSQTAFLRFMGKHSPRKPPEDETVDLMTGIVRRTADYANYEDAIGFSFRYFVTEMMGADDVKLLSIDGVAPTPASIDDESYPLSSPFYAVTRADNASESLTRLLAWILSPQGQALVEKTGYCHVETGH